MLDRDLLRAADVNFATALTLGEKVNAEPMGKLWSKINVADAQFQSGIDPTPLLDQVEQNRSLVRASQRGYLAQRLATSFADAGIVDRARRLAKKTAPFNAGDLGVWLDIAKAERGANPETVQKTFTIAQDGHSSIHDSFSWVAKVQHDVGLDPTAALDRASEDTKKERGGIPIVAKAYAYCGLFDQALDFATRMRPVPINEVTKKDIQGAYFNIANYMLRDGKADLAVETVGRTNNSFLTTRILAGAAVVDFQAGRDPNSRMNEALSHAESIRPRRPKLESQAVAYAEIAEAQAKCGIDSVPTLTLAFNKLNELPDAHNKVDAMNAILGTQQAMRMDLTPGIELTSRWIDKMTETADWITWAEQALMRQDLAVFAASVGNFEQAIRIAESLPEDSKDLAPYIYSETAKYQRLAALGLAS